ncbi:MAG TPA: nuclear transport factor 2 family protein [Solirubrobacteraceae bacterium]|nr:nuclear transport factor 2 family protein [Solirubrobacteraceae bacterium]
MSESANVALVKRFYAIGDGLATGDPSEMFTDDVQIFFPKFGIGHGMDAMMAIAHGRFEIFSRMLHHADEFKIIEQGDTVVVEGTTEGETVAGQTWDGRKTIPGHFCSVMDFRDGRISRMHVYLDPDFGNEDTARYPWHKQGAASA